MNYFSGSPANHQKQLGTLCNGKEVIIYLQSWLLVVFVVELFPWVCCWLSVEQQVSCVEVKVTDTRTWRGSRKDIILPGHISKTSKTSWKHRASQTFTRLAKIESICGDFTRPSNVIIAFCSTYLTFEAKGLFSDPWSLLVSAALLGAPFRRSD